MRWSSSITCWPFSYFEFNAFSVITVRIKRTNRIHRAHIHRSLHTSRAQLMACINFLAFIAWKSQIHSKIAPEITSVFQLFSILQLQLRAVLSAKKTEENYKNVFLHVCVVPMFHFRNNAYCHFTVSSSKPSLMLRANLELNAYGSREWIAKNRNKCRAILMKVRW